MMKMSMYGKLQKREWIYLNLELKEIDVLSL